MKDKKILPQSKEPKGEFEAFLKDFQEYESKFLIERAQNEFLDAYSRWLKSRLLADKLKAIRKGMKFEALSNEFSLQQIFPLK
ncbi:MAG: hypothetical protein P9M06_07335 [Candidatus Saelkia tenebricola]|nr:hypothetical protein [Candidatus Saelkia tenebricola]